MTKDKKHKKVTKKKNKARISKDTSQIKYGQCMDNVWMVYANPYKTNISTTIIKLVIIVID